MNHEGIDIPERQSEYKEGVVARKQGLGRDSCPYGFSCGVRRSLFLCGWHQTDMALAGGKQS
ncbi:hypothetical protein D3C78_1990820 [compost metagenome]